MVKRTLTAPRAAIPAGECVLHRVAMLSGQAGSPPDLALRWNAMPENTSTVDLVLHLHGYATTAERMHLVREKLPISGLDFADPDGAGDGRGRPTLAILPRGRFFGGRTGAGYDFQSLREAPGTRRLVRVATDAFGAATGLEARTGRRVLTAHSGGGVALAEVARQFRPDEIHVFDALYAEAPGLIEWAEAKIRRDAAGLGSARDAGRFMRRLGGALRVLYIAGTGTEPASLAVAAALGRALDAAGEAGRALRPWYRAEAVPADHLTIARRFGWRLLADAAADL
jgi:hypothetical protein